MPVVIASLRMSSAASARAVEFVALTAARSNEARSMTWDEVDFQERLWTVPGERMKAGKPHEVPLTDRAITILKERLAMRTGNLVWEGDKEGKPISDTALIKIFRAAGAGDATLHGLRSSFRDWAGDETSYPRDIAEAALAHTLKDKTEAAYRRGTALAKRRAMMNDWEAYLSKYMKFPD